MHILWLCPGREGYTLSPLLSWGLEKKKKKQKKVIAEAATNGLSTPNTPVQTPSQSSEDSATDNEKETVRIAD